MQNTIHQQRHSFRGLFSFIVAVLLLTVAITQGTQIYWASQSDANARRSQQDTGGQTASPNSGKGFDQQEQVRRALAKQYDTLYSDEPSIRSFLNMRGNTADFLGHNSATNRWLIAESKASDLDKAWNQLKNTTQAFVKANPNTNFEIRLYLDAKHFDILSSGGRVYNWGMRDGILGWFNEVDEWVPGLIEGVKVIVLSGA